jgi:protein-S-isoprenylcysteine O-methyltransferase Ste14
MLIHPSELASLIGGVVTLVGVLLTVIQLLRKSGRFNLTLAATLPGLVLVGLGVILLAVGAITAPPTTP